MEMVAAMNLLTICRQWLLITFCRSLPLLADPLLQNTGYCFVECLKGRHAVSPCTCQFLLLDSQELRFRIVGVLLLSREFRSKFVVEVV